MQFLCSFVDIEWVGSEREVWLHAFFMRANMRLRPRLAPSPSSRLAMSWPRSCTPRRHSHTQPMTCYMQGSNKIRHMMCKPRVRSKLMTYRVVSAMLRR